MSRENVRISEAGHRLLDNKELANKVAKAIMNGKPQLERDGFLKVQDEHSQVTVRLVTTLSDSELKNSK